MNAPELVAEVNRHGGRLLVRGDRLKVSAPEPLPDDLVDRLREHKGELLQLLGARQMLTSFGRGYVHPDGRIESGDPEPMPRPVAAWPADLTAMLRRVSTFFEWSPTDVADFRRWAQRSPDGLADARAFIEGECAKLPAPGLIGELGN